MKRLKTFEGWKDLAVGGAIAAASLFNPSMTLANKPNITQSIDKN